MADCCLNHSAGRTSNQDLYCDPVVHWQFLASADAGWNCARLMRLPDSSPILDKNRAAMGPEILSSTGAGVWRKAPMAFPDSSSALDKFQSAINQTIAVANCLSLLPASTWGTSNVNTDLHHWSSRHITLSESTAATSDIFHGDMAADPVLISSTFISDWGVGRFSPRDSLSLLRFRWSSGPVHLL